MTNDTAFFDPERSTAIVNGRIGPSCAPRLRELLESITTHLHAAVKEVGLTQEEWAQAIDFLTRTGQICSTRRQEFILLSDVLGISMLVDAINNVRPGVATPNTVLGPFHVKDAPRLALGGNIDREGKGEPLLVHGRITDTQGNPIGQANIDVWQTNDEGFYDVQQEGKQPQWNLRGQFTSDVDGIYWFRGTKPRWYPIPSDGPVGDLLAALDRPHIRPAHLHFIIEAAGYQRVVTHIFTPDCPHLSKDAVFGVKDSLIGQFKQVTDEERASAIGLASPFWEVECNFILVREAP